jgi:GT2 family glycosyltransferase
MPELSISIVSSEKIEALNKCLDNIFSNIGGGVSFEVFVVDNGSNISGSIERTHPKVKLIINGKQKGFSENHNNVIRQSSGDHVLVMNPDVYIQKGFIETMLKIIRGGEKIGIVAPKLIRPDGKTLDSAGHVIYKNRRTIDRGQGEIDTGKYGAVEEVFSACAAAMLCRREMLEDIKLFGECFDGSFKLYKEDLDLCWRARLRGWKIVYAPDAVAYHERGWGKERSRAGIPRWIRRESFKNRYLTMIKNDHFINFLRDMPFIVWHELKALVYVIFREPHLFLAWGQILMSLPLTFKKRAEIMKKAVVGPDEIRKWFA